MANDAPEHDASDLQDNIDAKGTTTGSSDADSPADSASEADPSADDSSDPSSSTADSTGTDSSSDPSPATGSSSIDTMNQLRDSGKADLKLSAETRDAYVKAVTTFRDLLDDQLGQINGLPHYGDPGGFASAQQTKRNLESGCDEFKRTIVDYQTYLDSFADTVKKSADRLIQSG